MRSGISHDFVDPEDARVWMKSAKKIESYCESTRISELRTSVDHRLLIRMETRVLRVALSYRGACLLQENEKGSRAEARTGLAKKSASHSGWQVGDAAEWDFIVRRCGESVLRRAKGSLRGPRRMPVVSPSLRPRRSWNVWRDAAETPDVNIFTLPFRDLLSIIIAPN